MDRDEVDIGVGIQTGPWYCAECFYDESNPYTLDDERGYPPPSARLEVLESDGTGETYVELSAEPDVQGALDRITVALHAALAPDPVNPGLARIGNRMNVSRIVAVLRDPAHASALALLNPNLLYTEGT